VIFNLEFGNFCHNHQIKITIKVLLLLFLFDGSPIIKKQARNMIFGRGEVQLDSVCDNSNMQGSWDAAPQMLTTL